MAHGSKHGGQGINKLHSSPPFQMENAALGKRSSHVYSRESFSASEKRRIKENKRRPFRNLRPRKAGAQSGKRQSD